MHHVIVAGVVDKYNRPTYFARRAESDVSNFLKHATHVNEHFKKVGEIYVSQKLPFEKDLFTESCIYYWGDWQKESKCNDAFSLAVAHINISLKTEPELYPTEINDYLQVLRVTQPHLSETSQLEHIAGKIGLKHEFTQKENPRYKKKFDLV